jgi:hypothetical protein
MASIKGNGKHATSFEEVKQGQARNTRNKNGQKSKRDDSQKENQKPLVPKPLLTSGKPNTI